MKWIKVLEDETQLKAGRVMVVTADHKELALTRYDGQIAALDNKCPHQGGPLGEGSIEKGLLRCPWHGWDFHPTTGKPPGGYDDGVATYKVKLEAGAVYVAIPAEKPHQTTVADLMTGTMNNWGVDTVFGMVGHSNLGLADAMRRATREGRMKYIAIRHEGAGAFAASAYGKLTGKPAACFAIAGPGSTNMFTGMWDAKVDRAPLLALTGQVATQVVGTGNFQELDLVQAFSTVADFNQRVQKDSKHTELMTLALKHAILNRKVSHLTFPDEVQQMPAQEGTNPQTPKGRISSQKIAPPAAELTQAIKALRSAKRPVIIMGHGARFHTEMIITLAEELQCPVLTTFKGKGLISDKHPLGGGVLGRSGTPIASWFMNESDLLCVFGASFSNHTGITPKKPTIQVDFDPLAIGKFHQIDYPVYGEIGVTAETLYEQVKGNHHSQDQREEIAGRWQIWRQEKQRRLQDDRGKGVSSMAVFDALSRLAPKNAIMCVDVGNNAYSLGRYFESKQHSFLMSGYLGSIGFALPAALGAWAAAGDKRPVIAVAGDGGLAQYLAEWTTVVRHQMPVKLIVLNNNELGKISKEQRSLELDVWETDMLNPDFAAYARSCGSEGMQISKNKKVEQAMHMLMDTEGPALLEIKSDVKLI